MTKTKQAAIAFVSGVAVIAVAGLSGCASVNQETHTNCVVQQKDRLVKDGNSDEKRVVTTCGVFAVEDSIAGGFNSYDTYASLEEGKAYDIRTGGFRFGLASMFPTVIEVKPVG